MSEALRLADELEYDWEARFTLIKSAAELRRLHAENEALKADTKSLATMSNLWAKEKALNAELVEALRWCIRQMPEPVLPGDYTDGYKKARAALAKAQGESNGQD